MARPREFDMDVAIAQIGDVFWDGGFEATSITDLEDATGLARARLYAAFGTKRDMLHRSIDNVVSSALQAARRMGNEKIRARPKNRLLDVQPANIGRRFAVCVGRGRSRRPRDVQPRRVADAPAPLPHRARPPVGCTPRRPPPQKT